MFAASKTDSVSASAPDDKFNYVTMLLHGDGTNGAQNNTFVDSSSNNFSITRNGNTTQGTFSPYGSNWSVFFENNPCQLVVANSTPLNLSGGAYTIEGWINPSGIYSGNGQAYGTSGYNTIVGKRDTSCAWEVYLKTGTGVLSFYNGTDYNSSTTPTTGVWNHFAAVFDGTNISLYLNGSRVLGPTALTNSDTSASISIGNYSGGGTNEQFRGYLSNLRITKGGALYSGSTYTVPSTTLTTTVSSGTVSLLTCQSNRYIDNSVNNASVTVNTGITANVTAYPSVQRFNPFGTSTAYSTSVIGGSAYFDGSGDYLTGTGSSNLAFGSGDFTIELWVYFNSVTSPPAYQFIYSSADSSVYANTPVIYWYETNSSLIFNNGSDLISTTGIKAKTWYHVAISRSSTTTKMFLNGAQVGSATDTTTYINQPSRPMIGANGNGSGNLPFSGYISDVRCVKGTAVYTSAFTPPTAPLTAITNTQLLLNFTNGAIIDNAMMNDLETAGNVQISTSIKKFGTGSIKFDGTGDYLKPPFSPNYVFGTGDFTIEFWIYIPTINTLQIIFDFRQSNNGAYPYLFKDTNNVLYYYVNTATRISGTTALTANTWYHAAICRSGTSTKMFLNGVQEGSTYTDSTDYVCNTTGPTIGSDNTFLYSIDGYIDDFRITKGYARYTSNFTAPTASFSDTGPI